jgi:hypothetical protein
MDDGQSDLPVALTRDEALVLFEWLSHQFESGGLDELLSDGADWVAVHRLLGRLESALAEPFHPDYKVLLGAARDRLRQAGPSV